MRSADRLSLTLAPAALVALSLSVGIGSAAAGTSPTDRRTLLEHEQAVASLIACLEAAARNFAGQPAAVVERDAASTRSPAVVAVPHPSDAAVPLPLRPHLSRLNLPPPTSHA